MNDEPTFDPRRESAIRDLVVTSARVSTSRRGRGRRAAVVAALVVVAVGLSGGVAYALGTGLLESNPVASVSPAPDETRSPSSTPSAAATTAPTAAPPSTPTPSFDSADPGTWIIGFDEVGPVKLGPSLEEQRQTLPAFDDITDALCVGAYLGLEAPTGFSLLFVTGPDQSGTTAAITFGINASTPDDLATSPKTAAGIGLGSSKEELLEAYPGIEQTGSYQSDDYPYYGLTDGSGGWIVFGLAEGTVGRIQVANEARLPIENGSVRTMPSERCPA